MLKKNRGYLRESKKFIKSKPVPSAILAIFTGFAFGRIFLRENLNVFFRVIELCTVLQKPIQNIVAKKKMKNEIVPDTIKLVFLVIAKVFFLFLLWVTMWIGIVLTLTKYNIQLEAVLIVFFLINALCALFCNFHLTKIKDNIEIS